MASFADQLLRVLEHGSDGALLNSSHGNMAFKLIQGVTDKGTAG